MSMKYPILINRGNPLNPSCIEKIVLHENEEHLAISRASSSYDQYIVYLSLRRDEEGREQSDSFYEIGTLCHVDTMMRDPNLTTAKITIRGIKRVIVEDIRVEGEEPYSFLMAKCKDLVTIPIKSKAKEENITKKFEDFCKIFVDKGLVASYITSRPLSSETLEMVLDIIVYKSKELDFFFRQSFLEEASLETRANLFFSLFDDIQMKKEIQREIDEDVQKRASRAQREYILREQMRTIQDKLGEITGEDDEDDKILSRIESDDYPENIKERVRQEMKKLKQLPAGSLESSMLKTYILWLVDLPWNKKTIDNNDLKNAQKVLDEDHYGLEKVKERIIEYLAVKSMTNSLKAPIICLYGPPGVGKTSLAKSVARALERKFVKASLGGTSDEAEIRGHRRTYVASMPGKIIKGIKNAGVSNPVFLLDEIDKLTANSHGDPASALLEVLDPEQNALFQDNYLEETYDLSNVLFICTANYLENIPPALRDRLELIELNTYTEIEKLNIALEHLISKQCELNGLKPSMIEFDEDAILQIIRYYTREAGVRELERKIATCCRKAIVELLNNSKKRKIHVTVKKIKEYLGTEIFDYTHENKKETIGVVTGLAYTQFGGDILPIEVNYFAGKGGLVLTGNLGNVMKESASIALDYVKANASRYKIDESFFMEHDIHIHVPEGAVPKDGPSAGIALTVAIVSAVKKIPLKATVAMTGEVNLRGEALAIGGLKEKTLAALRNSIEKVLIPKENARNIDDLPNEVKQGITIKQIECVDDALKETLVSYDFL